MPEKYYRYEIGHITWIHADPPGKAPVPTFAVMKEIDKPTAMQYARDKLRHQIAHPTPGAEVTQTVEITMTEGLLLLERIDEMEFKF